MSLICIIYEIFMKNNNLKIPILFRKGEKMLKSIDDIIELHNSKGDLEDAYIDIHFDEKILRLNTFTLKFKTVNAEREETKKWNDSLNFEFRKNRNLYKEIKEFRVLFEALDKLKIKVGYLEKTERPDFILENSKGKIGIEITKIYSGNDWAAEKLSEDIRVYNLNKEDTLGYIEYKKYNNKIVTYTLKENMVIKPLNKKEDESILKVKLKNKLFEKIRKLFDEYAKYDMNVIIANIVSPQYFESVNDLEKFNEEIAFYMNHLEIDNLDKEYLLLLKIDKKWVKFDLKKHTWDIL